MSLHQKSVFFALFSAFLFLAVAGCGTGSKQKLTIAGSTSVEPFAERLAELYMRNHPEVEINVQGGGSSAGIRAVTSHICQIGMSSRHLTDEEAKTLHQFTIAYDGIVLVVNRQNPVRNLTLEQARALFSGRLRFWDELGWEHRRITLVTREEGSGTRASFEEMVMKDDRGEMASFSADALVQDSNGAVREIVARDPAAIGYISMGLVDERCSALSLNGITPNDSTIRSCTYPLSRRFLFLTSSPPQGLTKQFIDYVLSPEGQRALAEEGLTPVSE
ncbi:MAG: phosphate ABC transporter substrate-binding protein [candidate division WOR-3 bacterium]